jgi:hypothetical protein
MFIGWLQTLRELVQWHRQQGQQKMQGIATLFGEKCVPLRTVRQHCCTAPGLPQLVLNRLAAAGQRSTTSAVHRAADLDWPQLLPLLLLLCRFCAAKHAAAPINIQAQLC